MERCLPSADIPATAMAWNTQQRIDVNNGAWQWWWQRYSGKWRLEDTQPIDIVAVGLQNTGQHTEPTYITRMAVTYSFTLERKTVISAELLLMAADISWVPHTIVPQWVLISLCTQWQEQLLKKTTQSKTQAFRISLFTSSSEIRCTIILCNKPSYIYFRHTVCVRRKCQVLDRNKMASVRMLRRDQ